MITAEQSDGIVELTMRNGGRANSINGEFAASLVRQLAESVSQGARVAILQAEPGVATWCAGHDISELPTSRAQLADWSNSLEAVSAAFRSLPIPVIAAVEGGVWGGGCELVMLSDLVVACVNSTFAVTPAKLGVPYSVAGVSQFLAALPVHVVNEMFLTADPIDARRAHELGVVNRLAADPDDLRAQAHRLATRVAHRAPLSVRTFKAQARALVDARAIPPAVAERLDELAENAWRSDDYQEGLRAFAERRAPSFTGS